MAGDAGGFAGLEPARGPEVLDINGEDFAKQTDDTIEISIDDENGEDLNQNAATTSDHLVIVANNGI